MNRELDTDRRLICYCVGWTERELRAAIDRLRLGSFEEVARQLLAGSGCTLCRPEIEQLLDERRGESYPSCGGT